MHPACIQHVSGILLILPVLSSYKQNEKVGINRIRVLDWTAELECWIGMLEFLSNLKTLHFTGYPGFRGSH